MFERLIGLETEYAIRPVRRSEKTPRAGNQRLFEALVRALKNRMSTAEAAHLKTGHFLANGGAVWFESTDASDRAAGLIEGGTPECRQPRDVIVYQRAQDKLFAEASRACSQPHRFCLIKNDRDSRGNIYGSQENYEATLATGPLLALWWVGAVLLIPLILTTWLGTLLLVIAWVAILLVLGIFALTTLAWPKSWHPLRQKLFGSLAGEEILIPRWFEVTAEFSLLIVVFPLTIFLYTLLRLIAFRRLRAQLTPFLLSRSVMCGAGMLDDDGHFHLADKAAGINCMVGFGSLLSDHPLYTFGHFFKAAVYQTWTVPRSYFNLFHRRHRLQLALGDSNMAQVAEYLRVGTTALVVEMIEANWLSQVPRVRQPIRSLHAISSDPDLRVTVPLVGGGCMTGLELQQFYLHAAQEFVHAQPWNAEAHDIVRLWESTLKALEEQPQRLFGSIDWVTKRHLIEEAGDQADWEARKKIDLRYHELSKFGYFAQIDAAGLAPHVVEPEEIERALRVPPAGTPATTRGHFIREFSLSDEPLRVNWDFVIVGRWWKARVYRLGRFGHKRRRPAASEVVD